MCHFKAYSSFVFFSPGNLKWAIAMDIVIIESSQVRSNIEILKANQSVFFIDTVFPSGTAASCDKL